MVLDPVFRSDRPQQQPFWKSSGYVYASNRPMLFADALGLSDGEMNPDALQKCLRDAQDHYYRRMAAAVRNHIICWILAGAACAVVCFSEPLACLPCGLIALMICEGVFGREGPDAVFQLREDKCKCYELYGGI